MCRLRAGFAIARLWHKRLKRRALVMRSYADWGQAFLLRFTTEPGQRPRCPSPLQLGLEPVFIDLVEEPVHLGVLAKSPLCHHPANVLVLASRPVPRAEAERRDRCRE